MNRKQRRKEKSGSCKGRGSCQGVQALYGDAYPTMRLVRQPAIGDWQSVVERVREAFRDLAEGHRPMINSATESVDGPPASKGLGARIRRWLGAP